MDIVRIDPLLFLGLAGLLCGLTVGEGLLIAGGLTVTSATLIELK